jgi:hypothetical protein
MLNPSSPLLHLDIESQVVAEPTLMILLFLCFDVATCSFSSYHYLMAPSIILLICILELFGSLTFGGRGSLSSSLGSSFLSVCDMESLSCTFIVDGTISFKLCDSLPSTRKFASKTMGKCCVSFNDGIQLSPQFHHI